VLVAEQAVGKGVVQVWGDTTGFQAPVLTSTHEGIVKIFNDLRHRRPLPINHQALGWFIFCLAVMAPLALARVPAVALCLSAAFLGISVLCGIVATQRYSVEQRYADGVLETSALPRYPAAGGENLVGRLSDGALSDRIMVTESGDISHTLKLKPKVIVIISPVRPYSPSEVSQLMSYMKAGGKILVTAGYEARTALKGFLGGLDIDIAPDPYGSSHNSRLWAWRDYVLDPALAKVHPKEADPTKGSPYDAEISFAESYPLVAPGADVIATCWGRPLIVRRQVGNGMVTVVGDARFLTGKVLGTLSANVTNLRLVAKLLQ